jgi:hypothetical protein
MMALMDANLMMDGARCDVGAGSHDTCSVDGLRSWRMVGLKGGESASLELDMASSQSLIDTKDRTIFT